MIANFGRPASRPILSHFKLKGLFLNEMKLLTSAANQFAKTPYKVAALVSNFFFLYIFLAIFFYKFQMLLARLCILCS